MSVTAWRSILLAVCLGSAAITAISLFTDSIQASSALGFQVSRTADPKVVRVDAVDAGGAADASGVRVGDLVHVGDLAPGERYRLLTGVYPHEKIGFVVSRGHAEVPIHYVAGGPTVWRWDTSLFSLTSFWMLGFAALIGWRRADTREGRVLCLLLAFYPASSGLLQGSWIGPSPLADVVTAGAGNVLVWIQVALLATYASLVARPMTQWRIGLTTFAYASCAAIAGFNVVRLAALWNGSQPWVAQGVGPEWDMAYASIPYALAIACALSALAAAKGAERSRSAWIMAPLVGAYLANGILFVAPALLPVAHHGDALVIAYGFANFGSFLAPLGMTYALLNRRVLDIGFALNRFAIFSGVSIVIVGAFVLFEWALGSWLQEMSHTTSVAVGAGVALLLGFSVRFVHDRVEHVLDRIFFRKRHDDEEAIRRFAREAAFVTDRAVLMERTVDVLERHAEASFARVALGDGDGRYAGVSENDPAIVSLRTWHRRLDLHGIDTRLEGEFAYPMVSRGRLIGALLLGPKRSREAYAPDESDAIEDLAHHVGGVLDVLGQSEARDEPVLAELRAMRRSIADGFAQLRGGVERG